MLARKARFRVFQPKLPKERTRVTDFVALAMQHKVVKIPKYDLWVLERRIESVR
jgi:hypothetical protein